jgi:hypothetical protein
MEPQASVYTALQLSPEAPDGEMFRQPGSQLNVDIYSGDIIVWNVENAMAIDRATGETEVLTNETARQFFISTGGVAVDHTLVSAHSTKRTIVFDLHVQTYAQLPDGTIAAGDEAVRRYCLKD